MMRTALFILGFVLAWTTLRDVFYTVVVPGSSRGLLKVSRRLVRMSLAIWKRVSRRGIGVNFAPIVIVGSFATWMLLLVLGFGLMMHAVADRFEPPLDGFGHALYIAGGSIGTIGFGRAEPAGLARALVVITGLCGLSVMTLAVTYLIEVQSNIAHRDTGVLKISTTAGQPPCALVLLERYSALGSRDEIAALLREGRDWCATVLQSHASHPWLVYFRSVGTASGWPAALGTLMDVALIAEHFIEEPQLRGPAVLAREQAERVASELAKMLALEPQSPATSPGEVEQLCGRLAAVGFRLREQRDPLAYAAARDRHLGCIEALATHLGMPQAPLIPHSRV